MSAEQHSLCEFVRRLAIGGPWSAYVALSAYGVIWTPPEQWERAALWSFCGLVASAVYLGVTE